MTRQLPPVPHTEHLKKQAKELLATLRNTELSSKLADAQYALAKDYGFASWPALMEEVNTRRQANNKGRPSVTRAAATGDLGALEWHYQQDPQSIVKPYGEYEETALQEAAYMGHTEAVDWLLEHGADPFFRCKGDNAYPLHFAAEKGHLDIVKRFVELGCDVNVQGDEHKAGVIGWACVFLKTQEHIIEYLLSVGAKHTIFSAVAMEDHEAIQTLLQEDAKSLASRLSAHDLQKTPLHLAAERNLPNTIAYLVENGADPNLQDDQAYTPLMYALRRNNQEAAQVLRKVTEGAAFLLAIHDSDMDAARDALATSQDPKRTLNLNLLDAAAYGSVDQLEKLASLGADLTAAIEHPGWGEGCTPLHAAAALGNLNTIRFLLEQGADPKQTEPTHNSDPIGWAHFFNQHEAQRVLAEAAQH